MPDRFLQIHTLTSYPGVLLNRDDAGYAKRLPFGGAVRTRVSSQCLKRHWRTFDGEGSLADIDGAEMSVRSRHSMRQMVAAPLISSGLDDARVVEATEAVMEHVLGKNSGKGSKTDALQTGQIVVLGRPELAYIRDLVRELVSDEGKVKDNAKKLLTREAKKNLGALGNAAGLDAALFGRMTTSDLLSRGDAAIHVAHAFTVHAEEAEDDYFSAIDDLLGQVSEDEESRGSGHIGTSELTSGLFYGYVVVDVPLLVSNLTGVSRKDYATADRALAAEVVARLIRLIATVSPGAKLGSTAPYAYAHAILVEAGDAQPRTLANAFARPVRGSDILREAYEALGRQVASFDEVYPDMVGARVLAGVDVAAGLRDQLRAEPGIHSLPEVARWASERVSG
ncbi:MAG: type I-E CRISPR-associated protein Cas7/Cse4/CasC [Alphaproteobacteria bacterium]|nr:type I-E CRISPR-associated protein Cas7/Cse4/CasC [Alphaproteobacteria bacterium]